MIRGRRCSVCRHREHSAIDVALARHVSLGALAKRYGLGPDSLQRHRLNHMPAQLRAKLLCGPDLEGIDLNKLRETESQSLLANLVSLRNRLFASLDVAEEAGDGNMLARISGQLHRNMEIVGKLLGDLSTGNTTTNILIQPAYVELRVALVGALAAYPDARQAVAAVLHQIEGNAAADIAADTRALAQ
jgi:hypothetical protein